MPLLVVLVALALLFAFLGIVPLVVITVFILAFASLNVLDKGQVD